MDLLHCAFMTGAALSAILSALKTIGAIG